MLSLLLLSLLPLPLGRGYCCRCCRCRLHRLAGVAVTATAAALHYGWCRHFRPEAIARPEAIVRTCILL